MSAVGRSLSALLALMALAACAHAPPRPETLPVPEVTPATVLLERGIASVYAQSFAGKLTANGERYDPESLTAAHRTLPFGKRVQVVSEDNRRSVWVRINDRGPFVRGRVIDLSPAAAARIGLVGLMRVEIRAARDSGPAAVAVGHPGAAPEHGQ